MAIETPIIGRIAEHGVLPNPNDGVFQRPANACEITQITSDGLSAPLRIVWNSEAPERHFELYIANILSSPADDLSIRTVDTEVSDVSLNPGHYCISVRPIVRSRFRSGRPATASTEGVWSVPQYVTVNAPVKSAIPSRLSDKRPLQFYWYPVVGAVSYEMALSNADRCFTINARIDDPEAASFNTRRAIPRGQYAIRVTAIDPEGIQTPDCPVSFRF